MQIILIFYACLLISNITVLAQSDQTLVIKGKVMDKKTKTIIPYANISLKNTQIGTSTNQDGRFHFRVGKRHQSDTLQFSAMGYQSQTIPLKNWQDTTYAPTILLRDTVLQLTEVVINAPPPAVEIIRQAMANRKNTYLVKPHKLEGLYRIADRENGTYVRLTETAIQVYDDDWLKKDSRVVNYLAFRQSTDHRKYKWTNPKDNFAMAEGVLQVDLLKRPTRATHKNGFTKGFTYELTGYTNYIGQDVYVITARPRPETKWANYSAVFYVRRSDMAILQVDRTYDIPRPGWVNTDSTITKMTRDWISLRYIEQEHKMRLQYCSILLGGEVWHKQNGTKIMDFERSQEIVFPTLSYQNKPGNLQPLSEADFYKLAHQTNPAFWASYEQAVDTDLFRQVQADLTTLNQTKDSPSSATIGASTIYSAPHFSPVQLQSDFNLLRQVLQEAHPGLYTYTSEAAMNYLLDSVFAHLQQPQTEVQFYHLVSKVIASIHCGHTGAALSRTTQQAQRSTVRVLPIQLTFMGSRPFVRQSYAPEIASSAKLELTAIDGQPIQQIIDKLLAYLPTDGFIQTAKYKALERNFSELYAMYIRQTNNYQLTLLVQGLETTVQVKGILVDSLPVEPPNQTKLTFKILPKQKAARLTLASFGEQACDSAGRNLPTFLQIAFSELQRQQVQHLIIDLRGNTGGRDDYGALLYSYLSKEPFRYYDHIGAVTNQFSFLPHTNLPASFNNDLANVIQKTDKGYRFIDHPCLAIQKPRSPVYSHDVYVLIDGDSFSATAEFAAVAHYRRQEKQKPGYPGKMIFIGEETGGTYSGNNSGSEFILTLPTTGIRVFIPIARYVVAVGNASPNGRGVLPDYKVLPAGLNGEDEVLNQALKLIDKGNR